MTTFGEPSILGNLYYAVNKYANWILSEVTADEVFNYGDLVFWDGDVQHIPLFYFYWDLTSTYARQFRAAAPHWSQPVAEDHFQFLAMTELIGDLQPRPYTYTEAEVSEFYLFGSDMFPWFAPMMNKDGKRVGRITSDGKKVLYFNKFEPLILQETALTLAMILVFFGVPSLLAYKILQHYLRK